MKHSLPVALCLSFLCIACSGNGTGNSVKLVSDIVNKNEPTYTFDLHIPQVKGLTDEAVQKDINERLQKKAADLQTGFLKEIQDIVIDPKETTKSGLSMDYHAETLSQDLISLVMEVSPYDAGAAHPNHVTVPFTYDIATKKEIAFVDLFNTKEKYLERLSTLTIAQLIAESKKKRTYYEAKEQMIKEGAGPKEENFRAFAIENGNLVLYFDPYQVGPYVEGIQTVTLSRAEITDVLSNQGRKFLSETEKKS